VQGQGGGARQGKELASNWNSVASSALPPIQHRRHQQQHHQQQPHALGKQGRPDAMDRLSVLCAAAKALASSSLPSQQQLNRPTSEQQILTTAGMTSSASFAPSVLPLLPRPPRRLPSPPAPSSAPPPIPCPSVPPTSTFAQQQQPRQESAGAEVGIGNGDRGPTAAVLAQLASLKMIAHLQRETKERQRADEARLQR
jgi:hypothetical protein